MADWIKMRAGLLTNPKVTKMARTLLANPEFRDWYGNPEVKNDMSHAVTVRHVTVVTRVTVGGLLPVWASVNESVGRDGHLRHAGLFEVDAMAGIPGFGAAMAAVDWLSVLPDDGGLEFANFIEHNTVGQERSTLAKTAAERAKEYRERKALETAGTVTNGVTKKRDASRDTVTTEKNREEKNRSSTSTSAAKLPTCPIDEIIAVYHEVLPNLPKVRLQTKDRAKAIRKVWEWVLTSTKTDGARRAETAEQALSWLRSYFERATENDFLMGRTPRSGEHANWQCDIDFLMTDRGMKQVIEKTKDTP